MPPQVWIGFGFLAALVVFLAVSFFVTPKLTDDQRRTMQFLTALCAGVAGGFLSGASVFEATWATPTSKVALSGTAGFALFFAVWFYYPRVFTLPGEVIDLSIPVGWTFRAAGDAFLNSVGSVADYQGFTQAELDSPIKAQRVEAKSARDALIMLRLMSEKPGSIREYDINQNGAVYTLKVRG